MSPLKICTAPVISAVMLFGCSLSVAEDGDSIAWREYQSFQSALESQSTIDFQRYLSSEWIREFDEAGDEQTLEELKRFATYPDWLQGVESHHEKRHGDDLCLSVNGIALDGTPGTVFVQYVSENDRLYAGEIH